MTTITIESLTEGTLKGTGIFDKLMSAAKVHLDEEFKAQRIRGPEYSTVYLGQLESTMQTALSFLMQREKVGLEAQLLEVQVRLAEVEVQKANQELLLATAQVAKVNAELELIPLQKLQMEAQTALVNQQKLNAEVEQTVLVAQECKLKAEFDLTMENVQKAAGETLLMAQKLVTEKAQTMNLGVDDNSVLGRQKQLYAAQTTGFTRDSEQKVARIYLDAWNARRMTDSDGTPASAINGLDDPTTGRVMEALRKGVGIPDPVDAAGA